MVEQRPQVYGALAGYAPRGNYPEQGIAHVKED